MPASLTGIQLDSFVVGLLVNQQKVRAALPAESERLGFQSGVIDSGSTIVLFMCLPTPFPFQISLTCGF